MRLNELSARFEEAVCSFCGGIHTEPYAELEDWLCGLPGRFNMVRCTRCGLLRQNPRPRPEIIGEFYPDEYRPFLDARRAASPGSSIQAWLSEYGLRRRVRLVARYQPVGWLLDVGCSTGLFLDAARRYGSWEVMGVEPSQVAIEIGQRLGLNIIRGSFPEVRFEDASFDVVTMWDVLEHLHDPFAALHEVNRILRSDGYLFLRVPHFESLDARMFGRYWAGLDAPRHLYVFPRQTLLRMLRQAGFSPRKWWCWGGYHAFALSLQFLLRSYLSCPKQCLPGQRFLLSLPVRIVAYPWFAFVDGVLRRGSSLVIVAQKGGA